MENLEAIAERIRLSFDARTAARDRALSQARTLTRFCANAIRAVHRDERSTAAWSWTRPPAG
jgi:predicted translin family RNA/ssDNA-binding protein